MEIALRKMGNSTGLIIPKVVLKELKLEAGSKIDLAVQGQKIVIGEIAPDPRIAWAAELQAAADAGELDELDDDDMAWINAGNDFDAEWEW